MKKFLVSVICVLTFSTLLVGCNKQNGSNIKFEYIYDDYIDEEINEKDLLLSTYEDYQNLINKYYLQTNIEQEEFDKYNILVVFDSNYCDSEKEIKSINYQDNKLEILYNVHKICGLCAPHTNLYFYRIDKINSDVILKTKYKRIKDEKCDPNVAKKPILYIYPNENMYINIKMAKDNNIITSYPKYNNGWNVYVETNGNIYYNNREYYALYWDEYNDNNVDFSTGFYVESNNAIKFLEEKLDIIGLNNREANEFIMYWLPILENNKHSLVYFELTSEREENNKLIINPKPDSMLRINMHVKKINNKQNIKEQKLETFNRHGYTVVEWGGTIHKEE